MILGMRPSIIDSHQRSTLIHEDAEGVAYYIREDGCIVTVRELTLNDNWTPTVEVGHYGGLWIVINNRRRSLL